VRNGNKTAVRDIEQSVAFLNLYTAFREKSTRTALLRLLFVGQQAAPMIVDLVDSFSLKYTSF
jgi:hypothetical protein